MNLYNYRLIAAGWLLLILFLSLFWYATLRRLSVVLKELFASAHSRQSLPGFFGMFLFIIRAEYKQTGNERLISVCQRLRPLLYGYIGVTLAYIVFLVKMRPPG
jgi:hypothetical protein